MTRSAAEEAIREAPAQPVHSRNDPGRRQGRYGVDAPLVPLLLALIGIGLLVAGGAALAAGDRLSTGTALWLLWDAVAGVVMIGSAVVYLHTTLRGKFTVWSDVISQLGLRGDERALDLGCGRGAVLVLLALHLESGHAVGVDRWRAVDQSGNTSTAAQTNAQAEGVAARVDVCTGDLTAQPFPDAEFDLVVSSMTLHIISGATARAAALDEAVRVLRPGGRLALVDFRHTADYEHRLAARGIGALHRRRLGWRFWYGGPWSGASLVTGTKPAS